MGSRIGPRGRPCGRPGHCRGRLVHTLCAATGITALVAAWPPSFDLLRYAGALYLLWLACRRSAPATRACRGSTGRAGFGRIVRMAWLNNLVNPKALLFFMVFLPQFVDPARGSVPLQLVQLGVVLSWPACCSMQCWALAAERSVAGCSAARRQPGYGPGCWPAVMFGLAVRLLLLDRPARRI